MPKSTPKILVVDDEPDILEFVRYNLQKEGFKVLTAKNGQEALKVARREYPILILLDIMMPEVDGIEVCRQLRRQPEFSQTLIAFLTARHEDYTQITGLDSGADDYIMKPIPPGVLVSRIKALLRRKTQEQVEPAVIQVADLVIDKDKVLVLKAGQEIILAKKEFKILVLLASRPGKVFSREEIFHTVWGSNVIVGNRTIDVHIRKLREKIGSAYIRTIKGLGYKFDF